MGGKVVAERLEALSEVTSAVLCCVSHSVALGWCHQLGGLCSDHTTSLLCSKRSLFFLILIGALQGCLAHFRSRAPCPAPLKTQTLDQDITR